jgi:hypothetical protein
MMWMDVRNPVHFVMYQHSMIKTNQTQKNPCLTQPVPTSPSQPCPSQQELDWTLVVHAASDNFEGAQSVLDLGADPLYCNGLPMLVAATNGSSEILELLMGAGDYTANVQVMRLAVRVLIAKKNLKDANYLAMWADIFTTGRMPNNDHK